MGTPAEHRLLGALLQWPDGRHEVESRVSGKEFPTPVLGAVFDHLCSLLATGARVDATSVSSYFRAWGIRGVSDADPYVWDSADVIPFEAPRYADVIRDGHLRRMALALMQAAREDIDGDGPAMGLSRLHTRIGGLLDTATGDDLPAKTLAELLAEPDTGYDWVIPGMLERSDRLVVTGHEGGGKTTFLRQLALCTTGGLHPFTHHKMPAHRVLVIDVENTEKQWRREATWILNRVLAGGPTRNPAADLVLSCNGRMDVTRATDIAKIHRLIDQHDPALVMIGPIYKLAPKFNNDEDAGPVIAALDSIRDRGIALLIEAHGGKGTDADGERDVRPRGSSALMGWPEFGFGIRAVRDDPERVALVRWRGDRDQRHWPDHLIRGRANQFELPWQPAVSLSAVA